MPREATRLRAPWAAPGWGTGFPLDLGAEGRMRRHAVPSAYPPIIKATASTISHSCRGHASSIAAALQLPPGSGPEAMRAASLRPFNCLLALAPRPCEQHSCGPSTASRLWPQPHGCPQGQYTPRPQGGRRKACYCSQQRGRKEDPPGTIRSPIRQSTRMSPHSQPAHTCSHTGAHTHLLTHTCSHTETYVSSGLNCLYLHFVICGTPGSFQRLDFASCEI